MPRLFTGLEIPSDPAMDLSMLRGGISGARWIDAENYHLTLRFIGDIDDSTARDIHATLENIRRPPFTVTIEELGFLRRRQAQGPRRQGQAGCPLGRTSGRTREAHAAHRHCARAAQIHSPRHARAAARGYLSRRRRLSFRTGIFPVAPVRGEALRLVLVAGIDRRRPLCRRGGVSARMNGDKHQLNDVEPLFMLFANDSYENGHC